MERIASSSKTNQKTFCEFKTSAGVCERIAVNGTLETP